MGRIPLTGGAYTNSSLIAYAQRCVNLYPESNPPESESPVPVTQYPRPALTLVGTPPALGRGRGLYVATNGDLYAIIEQTLYYVNPDFVFSVIGTLVKNAITPVCCADNGTNIMIVDGSPQAYTVSMNALRTFLQVGDPNCFGGDRIDFLDYFLIMNKPATPLWYSTLANSVGFNGLYFGQKTAWPDNIDALAAVQRTAWILGPQKGENWYNAGTVPFPFQPVQGNIIEQGIGAKHSIAKMDTNLYWLSQTPEGARMVMKGAQNTATRISNHGIEELLLHLNRVDDAIGSCYQIKGHSFYKLTFPTDDLTIGYDEATKQWHEDAWFDGNGAQHRARNTFNAYAYGKNLALDWATGHLYKLDELSAIDQVNGVDYPIRCIRGFPHLVKESGQRVTYPGLIADIAAGAAPAYPDYYVSARFSHDRGGTWSSRMAQPLGGQGKYNSAPTWRRLGYARDMVVELDWAVPFKTALNGAWLLPTEDHEADL